MTTAPPRSTPLAAARALTAREPWWQAPRVLVPALLVLCLATRLGFLMALPWCAEDAYITFRYARNWAEGLGPVYNVGEREWGFTSALWTSVLAAAARAGLPSEGTARAVLVACDLVTLVLGWRLLAAHTRLGAFGFGLFFALSPRLAQMPSTGLESSLVVALLLAAASLARSRAGGALNGLLALSRPEGAAMSVLLAARLTARQRVVWLAVASLQAGFALWFGRLVPSSVSSKATVYGIQPSGGAHWFEWLVPGMTPQTHDGEALAPLAMVLLAGLIAMVVRWRRPSQASLDAPLPLLVACGALTLAGYAVLGVPWFFWYAPAPMVAIALGAFLGLGASGVLRWTIGPLALYLGLALVNVTPRVVALQRVDVGVFAGIGQTLRDDAAGRDAAVLLEPIGLIGWQSRLRVVDEVGLVTPWVAEERAKGDGWYARVIERARPEYLVIRRDWLEGGVAWAGIGAPFASQQQRDRTMAGYEVVRRRSGPITVGAGRLLVLRAVTRTPH